jgi:uncharacterized HhH-GPD family protein
VTLSDDPAADMFLAENPNALLLGVLYDSQYATRKAFAVPLRLRERLGHLDMAAIAAQDPQTFTEIFRQKPALHRFPGKFAAHTQHLAGRLVDSYGGDATRIWGQASSADDLAGRLLSLPAFGVEKTNWTMGMLGHLGLLPFSGWEEYRVRPQRKKS